MRRLALVLLLVAAAAGCVERRMTLITHPAGARAYYNGDYVGETPVTFHFTHYQAGDLRFEKDGYRTYRVAQEVKQPAYQQFPLDFFAEVLWPWTIVDEHAFDYTLEERSDTDVETLLERAAQLEAETLSR